MSILPNLFDVLDSFFRIIVGSALLTHVIPSLFRVVAALFLSALIGIPFGFVAAMRGRVGNLCSSFISGIRYLPPTAFIGLLVLSFGIGSQTAVALMVLGVAPFVAVMAADAFKTIPADYYEVARVFGANRDERFWRITFPYVAPQLVDTIKVNVGAAWTFLVVAEIIAGNNGIGYLIARAQRFLDIPQLYALLLLCGVCGLLMDRLLNMISLYLRRWSKDALD